MLKRLCNEKPKQWHRYINALLFAYREVPQDSTHFAPFELMYGMTVRGPIHILRELWIRDIDEPEVKSSYQYVLDLRERLNDTLKARQKKHFDKKTMAGRFMSGRQGVSFPPDRRKQVVGTVERTL